MMSIHRRIINAVILHTMVVSSWAILEITRRRYVRLQRALESFEATYQFTAGNTVRQLIFSEGRVQTKSGKATNADFELILMDPTGVVKQFVTDPNNVLKLLVENKIDHRGNHFFLLKYGYLLSLSQRYFEDLRDGITRPFFRKRMRNEC